VAILPRRVRVTFHMIYRKELLRTFLEGGPLSQRKTCAGVVGSVTVAKMDVSRSAPTVVEELVLEIS
jgi:hypothetical protein